ncbi:MAG: Cytidylate kinase [Chlamydiota bacterium]|jgi:cytidylate kinase
MIITIDGPSGTGKSTTARGVAVRLGFAFFDTGAMYRSFAWSVLHEGLDPSDEDAVTRLAKTFRLDIQSGDRGGRRYFVGSTDVTDAIRSQLIAKAASQIAVYIGVRLALVKIQRAFGQECDAVFEGRDMGTVVFPEAELKIFLTASPEVRAKRRLQEMAAKQPGAAGSFETVLAEIKERDETDMTRAHSPLKRAPGAIEIDTTHMSLNEVIDAIVTRVPKHPSKFRAMQFSYWLVRSLALILFKCFYRLEVIGVQNLRKGRGIIAANHVSFYDPPLLSTACPEEVHFLARDSLFKVPCLGGLIRRLNAHPVAGDASDTQTLRLVIRLLEQGEKVIIFPEGQRSPDGSMRPFERGLAFLAFKTNAPVYPVFLSGVHEVWPPSRKFPRLWGKVRCVFGSPIKPDVFDKLSKREAESALTMACEKAVQELGLPFEH